MKQSFFIIVLSCLLAPLATQTRGAATARQIAIVSGAELSGSIDMKGISASPIMQKRDEAQNAQSQDLRQMYEARKKRFEAATGLTEEDLLGIYFSCDLDTFNMNGATQRDRMGALSGLAAAQLAKPLTIEKLKHAAELEYGSTERAGVTEITIAGRPALRINASEPTDPHLYLSVSPEGRVLLMAFNAASIEGALKRMASGMCIKEPARLIKGKQALAPKSQFKATCVIPDSVRSAIDAQIASMNQQMAQNPGLAVGIGFVRLFRGMKELSVGLQFDTGALLSVAASLGTPMEAQQAGILLESWLIPMVQAALMQSGTTTQAPNLQDMVRVKVDGDFLQFRIRFTEDQIMSGARTAASAAGRSAPSTASDGPTSTP